METEAAKAVAEAFAQMDVLSQMQTMNSLRGIVVSSLAIQDVYIPRAWRAKRLKD